MCEHERRCDNCISYKVNREYESCKGCIWNTNHPNFKCAICKKEKSPLTDDNSKT